MKTAKRILALTICLLLAVLCFTGCHKKNETAVTVGEYKFTSGYYACALVYADSEARSKIITQFEDDGKDTSDIDYMKQTLEGKKYETWVRDRAIELILENAGYKALCSEKGYKHSDETVQTTKESIESQWGVDTSNSSNLYYSVDYKEVFGNNGVSKETFIQFSLDQQLGTLYFDKTYGAEGTDPVSQDELKKTLNEKFALVDRIEISTSDLSDDDVKIKKAQLEEYLEMLNSGKEFSEVFVSYDTAEGKETPRSVDPGDGIESPTDPNAEIISDSENTDGFACDYYEDVTKMAVGEAKIIETDSSIVLVKRLDILADSYYLTSYDNTLRKAAVGDKADEAAKKKAKELGGAKQVKSAVNHIKVEKITYPE